MQLYNFFNSSTSWRVRIALALKGFDYQHQGINIRVGEQATASFLKLNPSHSVPLLITDDGQPISQSLAIIDYLDNLSPHARLIPLEPLARARVLEVANLIGCDIHPLNNLRVLGYLNKQLAISDQQKEAWYKHWIEEGMKALETMLSRHGSGSYCFGDSPSLADCCLVPQVANALRMGCELQRFEQVLTVYQLCLEHPAFIKAQPHNQPDYIG